MIPATRLAVLLLLLPVVVSAQERPDSAALPAGLQPVRAEVVAAYARLDAAAASAHLSQDVVMDFGGQVVHGRGPASGFISELLGDITALRFGAPYFLLRGSEVVERRSYVATTPSGAERGGRVELVWARQPDGGWKARRVTVM